LCKIRVQSFPVTDQCFLGAVNRDARSFPFRCCALALRHHLAEAGRLWVAGNWCGCSRMLESLGASAAVQRDSLTAFPCPEQRQEPRAVSPLEAAVVEVSIVSSEVERRGQLWAGERGGGSVLSGRL